MNYQPTYLGEIELNEETLAHFGVKGMKWGKVKARIKKGVTDIYKKTGIYRRAQKKKAADRHARYVGSHLAKDVADGRYDLRETDGTRYKGENARRFNEWRNEQVGYNVASGRDNGRHFKTMGTHAPMSADRYEYQDRNNSKTVDAYLDEFESQRRRKASKK